MPLTTAPLRAHDGLMDHDRNGLQVLGREECIQLLEGVHVGRVALSVQALPVVLPVNYVVMDGDVVIQTGEGTKLEAAMTNSVVAFEVDDYDAYDHTGWSVLVQGMAEEIVDPDELDRARAAPLSAWAGPKEHFVRITATRISGRRVAHGARVP